MSLDTPLPEDARIVAELASEDHQSDIIRFRNVTWSVVCGFLLALSVDYLVLPERVVAMAVTRVLICAGLVGLWSASRRQGAERHAVGFSLALFLISGLGIISCALVLGQDIGFHDALEIAYMVYAAFLPTRLTFVLAASTFLTAFYAVSLLVFKVSTGSSVLGSNVFLLMLAQAIAVGFVFSNNRLKKRSRLARLRENRSNLSLQKAVAELSETSRLLRESNESKSKYFADASHALRTPLTLILNSLEAIRDDRAEALLPPLPELVPCQKNGIRLLRLIDDILALSRIDTGRIYYRIAEFDFAEMVCRLVEETRALAARKELQVRVEMGPQEQQRVEGDAEAIERAILNLLGLAFQAATSGSQVMVELRATPSGSAVSIVARVDEKEKSRLERLVRALQSEQTTDELEIDLSLSKRVVTMHKGELRVQLGGDQASSFHLGLPSRCRVDDSARDRRFKASAPSAERRVDKGLEAWDAAMNKLPEYRLLSVDSRVARPVENVPKEGELTKPVALVIEHNHDIVDLIANALGSEFAIITAGDGNEGLARANQTHPDIVISDFFLPGQTGLDVARQLRQKQDLMHTPLILLADVTQGGEAASGLRVDAWLGKPFSTKEVRATARRLLSRKLKKSQQMREERDTSLRLLADGIAHEILNPIGFVQGAADILEQLMGQALSLVENKNEEVLGIERDAAEFFGSIREGVERTRGSIAELRKFSRPDDKPDANVTRVNDAIHSALAIAQMKGKVHLELSCDCHVMMARGKLDQIILNLLINATQAGGPACPITVTTGQADATAEVVLRVQDQGPGMDAATLAQIFDPYFTTKKTGTGLGLPLCKKMLQEAHGQISADSSLGRGTTMTIRLPIVTPPA